MHLVADSVTFAYNGLPVVREVSITLESGQVMGVIGPNGSGKSTLIRLLARAFPPQSGSISLDGRNLSSYGRAELARRVAVVAQSPQLPDAFTAEELILLGRTPYLGFLASEGPKDLAAARRAMEITDTLHFAQRRLAQLSGGERQRVVIARALAQEPDVLLLDEPTANLDLRHQTDLLQLTRDLAHRDGLTVVITLHDLNQAAQCADRLALLSEGRLLGVGEPASVLVPSLLSEAYRVPVTVTSHPIYKTPMVVPLIGHA